MNKVNYLFFSLFLLCCFGCASNLAEKESTQMDHQEMPADTNLVAVDSSFSTEKFELLQQICNSNEERYTYFKNDLWLRKWMNLDPDSSPACKYFRVLKKYPGLLVGEFIFGAQDSSVHYTYKAVLVTDTLGEIKGRLVVKVSKTKNRRFTRLKYLSYYREDSISIGIYRGHPDESKNDLIAKELWVINSKGAIEKRELPAHLIK